MTDQFSTCVLSGKTLSILNYSSTRI